MEDDHTTADTSTVTAVQATPLAQQPSTSQPPPNNQLVVSYTPNGSEQCIRVVESKFRPAVGTVFTSLKAGIDFYKVYARTCGFSTRLSSTKKLKGGTHTKLVVCSQQGFRDNKHRSRPRNGVTEDNDGDSPSTANTVKRRVKVTRIGCRAYIKFAMHDGLEGPAVIREFCEFHVHRLTSVCDRDLEKISRSVDMFQKQIILDNSKLNIGASKTFRQFSKFANGYQNIGATLVDFKNSQRDFKCYIGQKDADLFLDRLKKLKATQPGFYFDHEVDAQNHLTSVFWTDSTAVKNYSLFGDGVSVDPTYGTNKYDMVFCPFTGVNHHRKSVFFAGCLLFHENDESFKWAFQNFKKAMGEKEPLFIITDQCPAIKKAFPQIFTKARHRYCMWHITKKITDKVGSALCKDTDFLKRFNSVVWDSDLEPPEFEEKWTQLISDFELEDNEWLKTMFQDRSHWIPAYHRDITLGCILRTTQRSESANSFFKRYENHFGTLVEFWMRFETAIDQQRYTQRCDDHKSDHSFPNLETDIGLEKHGAIVYTHTVFELFQQEVKGAITCGVDGYQKDGDIRIIDVEEPDSKSIGKVTFNVATHDAECTCKLFERIGLLCRHIVWVFNGKGIRNIPTKYLLDRWLKNSRAPNRFDNEDTEMADADKGNVCSVWAEFSATVSALKTLPPVHMEQFASLIVDFRDKLCVPPLTKEQEIEMLLGCTASSEISVLPPNKASNKGSGKRLTSAKAQAIEKAAKPKRLCAYCKQRVDHDRRTCPLRIAEEAAAKASKKKK